MSSQARVKNNANGGGLARGILYALNYGHEGVTLSIESRLVLMIFVGHADEAIFFYKMSSKPQ